ncbi:hypothetical protein Droror1_Dr00013235 [Drosera rotundifolia]
MGDLRVDEWLPVGWNVEVKIGKNGKKESYYVDPVNGYMFRSIKDIDRYLLTGELGRNVAKPKEQAVGGSNTKLDIVSSPSKQHASKKKKKVLNGSNKWEKPGRSPKKKPIANSRKTTKPWKSLRSSSDDIDSVPFFKGDSPGQGERASTSYFSASAFGSLLRTQASDYEAKHDEAMIPGWVPGADPNGEFQSFLLEAAGPEPFFPECTWLDNEYTTEAELFGTVDDFHSSDMLLGSRDSESLFSVLSAVDDRDRMAGMETRTAEDPGSPHGFLFGDIYSDPCIDFAIKTLTSTLDPASGDYLQRQLGSSSTSSNDLNGSGVQAEGWELAVTQGAVSGL